MNCFQKSYLWLLNTTFNINRAIIQKLWIAFKNLIFDYWTQQIRLWLQWVFSCELLSKILSLTIEHNKFVYGCNEYLVVNCFQKPYLWLLNTTLFQNSSSTIWLWIAFKNLIFDYWTQHSIYFGTFLICCELLSKILSLTIEHNRTTQLLI